MRMNPHIRVVRLAILPRLLAMAVLIRLSLLVFMAVTDDWIPDHHAGNDVLTFDLRVTSTCFCHSGLACDPDWKARTRSRLKRDCVALGSLQHRFVSTFFLRPMTKWDAARFLTLALDQKQREPGGIDDPFLESEQAHAFFPLFHCRY